MKERAVCLISGGLDSAVISAIAKDEGHELYGLFFDYGQKNIGHERRSTTQLTQALEFREFKEISLPYLKDFGGSALFDTETPLDSTNFLSEYVPFRNSQFLAVATAWAEVLYARRIYIGSTGGDRVCPDNSPQYLATFQEVINQGTLIHKDITITAPLLTTDKTGAVAIGSRLKVPFEHTWSCHNERELACGECSNCSARLRAFQLNNLTDPIKYQNRS